MIICGIDPGNRSAGIALFRDKELIYAGIAKAANKSKYKRLRRIRDQILDIITSHDLFIDLVAVEKQYIAKYGPGGVKIRPDTALPIAESRALIVCSIVDLYDCEVVELEPKKVKKYATGKGNASKDLVRYFAMQEYKLEAIEEDAADALAIASLARVLVSQKMIKDFS